MTLCESQNPDDFLFVKTTRKDHISCPCRQQLFYSVFMKFITYLVAQLKNVKLTVLFFYLCRCRHGHSEQLWLGKIVSKCHSAQNGTGLFKQCKCSTYFNCTRSIHIQYSQNSRIRGIHPSTGLQSTSRRGSNGCGWVYARTVALRRVTTALRSSIEKNSINISSFVRIQKFDTSPRSAIVICCFVCLQNICLFTLEVHQRRLFIRTAVYFI